MHFRFAAGKAQPRSTSRTSTQQSLPQKVPPPIEARAFADLSQLIHGSGRSPAQQGILRATLVQRRLRLSDFEKCSSMKPRKIRESNLFFLTKNGRFETKEFRTIATYKLCIYGECPLLWYQWKHFAGSHSNTYPWSPFKWFHFEGFSKLLGSLVTSRKGAQANPTLLSGKA